MMKISPPAFPTYLAENMAHGMSLRDFFANHAMVGFLSASEIIDHPDHVARFAYEIADAMIKAREL